MSTVPAVAAAAVPDTASAAAPPSYANNNNNTNNGDRSPGGSFRPPVRRPQRITITVAPIGDKPDKEEKTHPESELAEETKKPEENPYIPAAKAADLLLPFEKIVKLPPPEGHGERWVAHPDLECDRCQRRDRFWNGLFQCSTCRDFHLCFECIHLRFSKTRSCFFNHTDYRLVEELAADRDKMEKELETENSDVNSEHASEDEGDRAFSAFYDISLEEHRQSAYDAAQRKSDAEGMAGEVLERFMKDKAQLVRPYDSTCVGWIKKCPMRIDKSSGVADRWILIIGTKSAETKRVICKDDLPQLQLLYRFASDSIDVQMVVIDALVSKLLTCVVLPAVDAWNATVAGAASDDTENDDADNDDDPHWTKLATAIVQWYRLAVIAKDDLEAIRERYSKLDDLIAEARQSKRDIVLAKSSDEAAELKTASTKAVSKLKEINKAKRTKSKNPTLVKSDEDNDDDDAPDVCIEVDEKDDDDGVEEATEEQEKAEEADADASSNEPLVLKKRTAYDTLLAGLIPKDSTLDADFRKTTAEILSGNTGITFHVNDQLDAFWKGGVMVQRALADTKRLAAAEKDKRVSSREQRDLPPSRCDAADPNRLAENRAKGHWRTKKQEKATASLLRANAHPSSPSSSSSSSSSAAVAASAASPPTFTPPPPPSPVKWVVADRSAWVARKRLRKIDSDTDEAPAVSPSSSSSSSTASAVPPSVITAGGTKSQKKDAKENAATASREPRDDDDSGGGSPTFPITKPEMTTSPPPIVRMTVEEAIAISDNDEEDL